MAVATPTTFLTSERDTKRAHVHQAEDRRVFRLGAQHASDLRDIARGVEETHAGVACRYLIDHELSGSGDGEDGEVELHELERFCERFDVWSAPSVINWRRRMSRSRRALARLASLNLSRHVGALHVVFGHPDPILRAFPKRALDYLAELAPLVRYTDAVESRRIEMARSEAVRLSTSTYRAEPTKRGAWCAAESAERDELGELPKLHPQSGSEEARRAINLGLHAEAGGAVVDLSRHRELYEWALRGTSSSDALREALAPYPEPRPVRRPFPCSHTGWQRAFDLSPAELASRVSDWEARKAAWEARQTAFLVQARSEAEAMLSDASRAYWRAWLEVGGRDTYLATADFAPTPSAEARDGRMSDQIRDGKRGSGWSST